MRRAIAALPLMLLLLGACGSEDPAVAPTQVPVVESTVAVELSEWSVLADPLQVGAGTITFETKNLGTEVHELVIVAADGREVGELPTAADGSVNEDEIEVLTEVEDLEPDASEDVAFDLDSGEYILFCNIVEGSDVHYKLGMRAALTVV